MLEIDRTVLEPNVSPAARQYSIHSGAAKKCAVFSGLSTLRRRSNQSSMDLPAWSTGAMTPLASRPWQAAELIGAARRDGCPTSFLLSKASQSSEQSASGIPAGRL